jgi:hypothetical protein
MGDLTDLTHLVEVGKQGILGINLSEQRCEHP